MTPPADWSLRQRLVALVCLLGALGLIAAGVLTAAALRSYLLAEVDRQLIAASGRLTGPGPGEPGDSGRTPFRGPSAFYTQLSNEDGTQTRVLTTPVDDASTPPDLPQLTTDQVAQIEGEPFTVGSDGPNWRVVAWVLRDGSGTAMVASSLGGVQATVQRLVAIQIVIGLVIVGAMVIAGRALVDRGLRPLTDMQRTASAIAGGAWDERVAHTHPRTEVGALGSSFNIMLDQLQAAFDAQRASESAARESEARMRRFIADASHELRTPLTTIRGYAELHRMGALSDGALLDDAMRRIEVEAARMGVLVSDLLLLARMDQERAFAADGVDLGAVAEHAMAGAAVAWPRQVFSLSADAPAPVVGDADRLAQVLSNLLSNAQRFNPEGQPIEVVVQRRGDELVLSVRDHGPGVPQGQAQAIFERFVRADDARSRSAGGAGLGLSIVSAIVAGHGGRVGVEQPDGGGARFVVVLPRAR